MGECKSNSGHRESRRHSTSKKQGWQGFEGESPEPAMRPTDSVNGSSLWAALAKPAERSKLEIVPSAMRLMFFISRQIYALPHSSADFLNRLFSCQMVRLFP